MDNISSNFNITRISKRLYKLLFSNNQKHSIISKFEIKNRNNSSLLDF